jgi:hypothetical protein
MKAGACAAAQLRIKAIAPDSYREAGAQLIIKALPQASAQLRIKAYPRAGAQ